MKDLISIIVPVYNVEKYIERCFESIINQTYTNIEILLIDDGSTDKSGEICDYLSTKDNRVNVYHKANGGLSDARNYGLHRAKGDFVTFIDSDDDIETFYIEELYSLVKKYNSEISICPYTIVSKQRIRNIGDGYCETVLDVEKCLSRLLLEQGFSVSSCAKLYKTCLFNDIKFPKGKLYEDNGTTYKLIMKSNKIAYGSKSVYNYYIRENSITNIRKNFSIKNLDYIYLTDIACEEILQKYKSLESECEIRRAVARFSILKRMANSELPKELKKEEKQIIKYLREHFKVLILNKNADKKLKISLLLLKISKSLFQISSRIYEKYK